MTASILKLLKENSLLHLISEQTDDDDDSSGDADADPEDDAEDDVEDDTEIDQEDDDVNEEEPPISTSVEDQVRLKDTLDSELEAVFGDFETRARKSASLSLESREGISIISILSESELPDVSDEFDINQFAADTSRLINNYGTLLDMEAIIYNKAKQFLTDKYSRETAAELYDILVNRHGLDFMEDDPGLDEPIAVVGQGATGV